jgi:hypothetical protein
MQLIPLAIEPGPWAIGWTAIAGIATATLALFTAWLAWSTRALARETDQDIRAAWRPILMPHGTADLRVREDRSEDIYQVRLSLTLRNTGRGPALNCSLSSRNSQSRAAIRWAQTNVSTIPNGRAENMDLVGDSRPPRGLMRVYRPS